MPDPDSPPPEPTGGWTNEYRIPRGPATPSLGDRLRNRIRSEGPLAFPEFMAAALYDPEEGYYAKGSRQVGRAGDFFTSVSVGPLFGELLARRFAREWRGWGSPARWRIIEFGSHDGKLAADVLAGLLKINPAAYAAVEYVIPEPLPMLQQAQRETLGKFGDRVVHVSDLLGVAEDPLPGIAFGNEVLDALPFHVVEWRDGHWRDCRVALDDDGIFQWQLGESIADPSVAAALTEIGTVFPDGYRTEVRVNFHDFMEPALRCLSKGLLLWIDYGFERTDYYHPQRTQGTLRTFSNHRAGEDPLANPGEIDITAHVDFTAVAEAAVALGCKPKPLRDQGGWLTELAREWLLELEGNPQPSLLRQFQTLIHPSQLGRSFQVMELEVRRMDAHIHPD